MSAQKVFSALGSVLRQTGQTIDAIGLRLQGKFGYKEGGGNPQILTAPAALQYLMPSKFHSHPIQSSQSSRKSGMSPAQTRTWSLPLTHYYCLQCHCTTRSKPTRASGQCSGRARSWPPAPQWSGM